MELSEWRPIMLEMGALYPSYRGEEATVLAFFKHLAPYPASVVADACSYLVSEDDREFFPPVGKILEHCKLGLRQYAEQREIAIGTVMSLGVARALAQFPTWEQKFPDVIGPALAALEAADKAEAYELTEGTG